MRFGALANATAAKIGSAPFAAFLKNSLLDWSSSFLFSFPINTEMDFYVFILNSYNVRSPFIHDESY